jgi:hypothetical protein
MAAFNELSSGSNAREVVPFLKSLGAFSTSEEECRQEDEDERLDSERQILLTMLLAQVRMHSSHSDCTCSA